MFGKKRNRLLAVLLALALIVGQFAGIDFQSKAAENTGGGIQ